MVDGQLDKISLSFLADDLQVRRGGIGANIAFGLGVLGQHPVLVGAVGADFAEYRAWLDEQGVDTSHVRMSTERHTRASRAPPTRTRTRSPRSTPVP